MMRFEFLKIYFRNHNDRFHKMPEPICEKHWLRYFMSFCIDERKKYNSEQ